MPSSGLCAITSNTRVLGSSIFSPSVCGYYTGIVTYLINVTVYYFLWKALYAGDADFARGYSCEDMVTYVAVGWGDSFRLLQQHRSEYGGGCPGRQDRAFFAETRQRTDDLFGGVRSGEAAFRLILLPTPAAFVLALIFPVRAPAGAGLFRCVLVVIDPERLVDGRDQLHRGVLSRFG